MFVFLSSTFTYRKMDTHAYIHHRHLYRNWIDYLPPTIVTVANPDAKRLYDDLLSNYNKLVRPVVNVSDALTVKIKLKLSQLIDVNLKNQIMTTNLWVEQSWVCD